MKSNSAETYSSFTLRGLRPWSELQHTMGEEKETQPVCTVWDLVKKNSVHYSAKDVDE